MLKRVVLATGFVVSISANLMAGQNSSNISLEKTALWQATERDDVSLVRRLLAHGASPYEKDERGWNALFCAIENKSVKVSLLLSRDRELRNSTTDLGQTPLMLAARKRLRTVVNALLISGAKVDARDKDGNDASFYCPYDLEELLALTRAGLKFGRHNAFGRTVLHAMVERLAPNTSERILLAVKSGNLVDSRDLQGDSPLMVAVSTSNVDAVASLLRLGANPKAKNKSGISVVDRVNGAMCIQLPGQRVWDEDSLEIKKLVEGSLSG